MTWYALYELATGNLRSTGTQPADAEILSSGVFGQVTFGIFNAGTVNKLRGIV